jgi:hypothetical protein
MSKRNKITANCVLSRVGVHVAISSRFVVCQVVLKSCKGRAFEQVDGGHFCPSLIFVQVELRHF